MYSFDQMLHAWVDGGHIPGAVLDISVGRSFRFQRAYGGYYVDKDNVKGVRLDTIFDLASLTKVTAALPSILKLAAEGVVRLDDPVSRYLPTFQHRDITIRHLLMHTSGLPAGLGREALERSRSMDDVIREISNKPLHSPPGQEVLYSDLSMILIGFIVEKTSGTTLDAFARQHIFEPLHMKDAWFCPPQELHHRIAATEWLDNAYLRGQVHDGTSRWLGGVCGHAGLFAAADDLHRYASSWLYPEEGLEWLTVDWVRECISEPYQGRGLGWEVYNGSKHSPPSKNFSCGRFFHEGSFGHTGFTGTSMWVDPAKELIVIFLTNVVHYGRKHNLPSLRPKLHDAIVQALDLSD